MSFSRENITFSISIEYTGGGGGGTWYISYGTSYSLISYKNLSIMKLSFVILGERYVCKIGTIHDQSQS